MLKEPVWIWTVPAYFYVGGTAGAAALLGAVAQASGNDELRDLVAASRRAAALGGISSTAFLVADLGRPERFLNMLRVFRASSPMSVGSWILAGFVPAALGSVVFEGSEPYAGLSGAAGLAAGALGVPLAGYTAVLLGSTAMPGWAATRRCLPWLFVASAASGAASALELTRPGPASARVLRRFGFAAKVAELVAARALAREAAADPAAAAAHTRGAGATMLRAATILGAGALVIGALAPRRSRTAGVLGSAASALVKFGVFHAGKTSARG